MIRNSKVIDGKVYVDLDNLLDNLHNGAESASIVAEATNDVALATQTMGAIQVCKALEEVLAKLKSDHGLTA